MKHRVNRRKFIDILIRGGLCVGFGYPIVIEPNRPVVEHTLVPISGLPAALNGLKIGFMADFHRGHFVTNSDIRKAADLLQSQKPDLILLGGDYVEGDATYIDACAGILAKLDAPLGAYAVLGNHDYWTDAEWITASLRKHQIRLLKNQSVKLTRDGAHFYVVGLDDVWAGHPSFQAALDGVPAGSMKILLVHEPDYADRISRSRHWMPLQLSGHSHGGQVVIPFKGPPHLPYLAQKYPRGLQPVSNSNRWVYTTRGVGVTIPIRFNCRPEISLLTIKSRKHKLS